MSGFRTIDGGPAFPTLPEHGFNTGEPGMALRDHFAGVALEGALAYPNTGIQDHKMDQYATFAYRMADAMLRARLRPPGSAS